MKYLRLKKNNDFQRLFKKGNRAYSRLLTVIYLPAKGDKPVMGIALSKKHGKAVKRNRIKRLIRACYSNNLDKLNGSYYMIIMPKICEDYCYKELETSLIACMGRMKS